MQGRPWPSRRRSSTPPGWGESHLAAGPGRCEVSPGGFWTASGARGSSPGAEGSLPKPLAPHRDVGPPRSQAHGAHGGGPLMRSGRALTRAEVPGGPGRGSCLGGWGQTYQPRLNRAVPERRGLHCQSGPTARRARSPAGPGRGAAPADLSSLGGAPSRLRASCSDQSGLPRGGMRPAKHLRCAQLSDPVKGQARSPSRALRP